MKANDLLGGAWLVEHYGVALVQPLAVTSRLGARRATSQQDGLRIEVQPVAMRQAPEASAHLTYHLKHEVVHLELLARVFDRLQPELLVAWISQEPTGQYARRVGFLYEWVTGRTLPLPEGLTVGGNYVDALDARTVLVATTSTNNTRWRVRDNLPGSPAFCPVVRWTDASQAAAAFDVAQAFAEQERFFGAEILRRSALWLTLKESRASFLIEGEQKQADKIQRFAAVLEQQTGRHENPLDPAVLADLQSAILGRVTTLERFGLRQSPVFVGQQVRYLPVVHYVAPPWPAVPAMLDGLATSLKRTQATAQQMPHPTPVARAAIAAYGFVYIHPLADGNGRVHRFLINDLLRRDGVLPAPFVLPVSGLITDSAKERAAYDASLEAFSKPFMRHYAGACDFAEQRIEADGVASNFEFNANDEAMHAWRFIDLTTHVVYMGELLRRTIAEELHQEAAFLRANDQARAGVKGIIEGPDADVDAIIRSARQNEFQLTAKLRKRYPALGEAGVWDRVVGAVRAAFDPDAFDGDDGP